MKILITAFKNWFNDDPFTQSAASAYYAIFALPGLLIITMAIAAFFFEQKQVEAEVFGHISSMLGAQTADSINEIVRETQQDDRDIWAMVVGIITLLFGATGLFAQLQRSLNRVWEVEIKKSAGWAAFIKSRLISFSIILVIGFLLLVSLSLTTALTVFGEWISMQFSPEWAMALAFFNIAFSFLTITALFTLIFKILPDAKVQWQVAFLGGALSTVLFTIGEYALNYYFEWAEPQSSFGAAGSVILLMLWVSYSCMILLIGAEFAKTYAQEKNGRKVKASGIAKKN
jgi:membrane protein